MGPQIQSGNDLPVNSGQDQELAAKIGGNSAQTTGRLAAADSPDVWIYRMVIGALGLTVLITVLGCVILTGVEPTHEIPAGIIALGSSAVGALAGLLAPFPAR